MTPPLTARFPTKIRAEPSRELPILGQTEKGQRYVRIETREVRGYDWWMIARHDEDDPLGWVRRQINGIETFREVER